MAQIQLEEEAEDCRRKALAYVGQPEATFLLRVAREFERLAGERKQAPPGANVQPQR
jgi:hypothetical protein